MSHDIDRCVRFCSAYRADQNATRAAAAAGIEYTATVPRGFYVYALVCPINNDVFYVGKGSSERMFMHFRAPKSQRQNERKQARLDHLRANGANVKYRVLGDELDEVDAYALESKFISVLPGLTNIAAGGAPVTRWIKVYRSTAIICLHLRSIALELDRSEVMKGGLTAGEIVDFTEEYLSTVPWNIKLPPDRPIAEIMKRYGK